MWMEIAEIFRAFGTQDSFEIRTALRAEAAWWAGAAFLLVAGFVIALIYENAPLFEKFFERTVMVGSYLAIAFIIFQGVIDRFVFSSQQPWSTTLPPLLFMIMAWFGAACNVRLRTHLSFNEFRARMPRPGQMACLFLDFLLWFGFALILFVTTARLTANSASNFQIVLGTDNTMTWWFLMTAPVAATLIATRAIENLREDIRNWRNGNELVSQTVIGTD